jgi:biotin transport system substrate-specific component
MVQGAAFMMSPAKSTLAARVWPDHQDKAVSGLMMLVVILLAGALILTLSAKIQVPFWPVPMTMQTFAVLCLGAVLGARLGALTVLLYLAEGAIGLPVFAGTPEKGIGFAYMTGPTGGYLVGFVIGAYVAGWFAERGWDRSIPRLFLAMLVGHVLIFVPGVLWLANLIGAEKAWTLGVAPFYAATLFKTALGAVLVPAAWRLLPP